MTPPVLWEDARQYALTKSFVEGSEMFNDILWMYPLRRAGAKSPLSIMAERLGELTLEDMQHLELGDLGEVFSQPQNAFSLYIEGEPRENAKGIDEFTNHYATTVALEVVPSITDVFEGGTLAKHPEIMDEVFLEYKLQTAFAGAILQKFPMLHLEPEQDNSLLVQTEQLQRVEDLDALFKFGFAYSLAVTSEAYRDQLVEVSQSFHKSLTPPTGLSR